MMIFQRPKWATLVSVDSMVYSLLMIAASPLTGAVGDALAPPGRLAPGMP